MSYANAYCKLKYFSKVLSDNAIYNNFLRMIDGEDWALSWAWLLMPEHNFGSFSFSLLFDIAPIDLEPLNLDFKVDLPSIEELLQGILAVLERLDLSEEFPWLKNLEDMIREIFQEEPAKQIMETRPQKAVYGKSKYNQCYYDPIAVRDFIRSTITKWFFTRRTFDLLRGDIERTAAQYNINPYVVQTIYTRLSMATSAHTECFILGYSILGKSKLTRRASEEGVVPFTDFDGVYREAKATNMDQLQWGFLLGHTPLGFGVLVPKTIIHKTPEVKTPAGITAKGAYALTRLVDRKIRRFRDTFTFNVFSLANYNRPEERRAATYSERADQWHALYHMRLRIEELVDGILAGRESNPVKIRLYKSAALQLLSAKAKRHQWGYRMYESMSEEEFKEWWLDHWARQGLDKGILGDIYARMERWLAEWRAQKLREGLRVRERRYRLAQLCK